MILEFSLLNNEKENIFSRSFVEDNYYSELQLKTIKQSYSRLLYIVELLSNSSKEDRLTTKRFTITNLWISIFKKNQRYFVFLTPVLFLTETRNTDLDNEYQKLVYSIDSLTEQCTQNNPHFDLSINKFFEHKILSCINEFNASEALMYESAKNDSFKEYETTIINHLKQSLNKKYLILGVGAVGKSSIVSQFFDNWDLEHLHNIKPTIHKSIKKISDSYIENNFTMIDLGGQEIYLQQHLSDPNLFKNLNTIIFVIDLQNEQKSSSTQKYFKEILEILDENKERPFISIFLHKYDPDLKSELESTIESWFTWLDATFSTFNIPFSYYLTSIKDNSARESLARTILLTIPNWFLALIIKKDLIFRSFNSLLPILSDINESNYDVDQKEIRDELFTSSMIFGQSITKIIIQNWIAHLMKDKEFIIEFDAITDKKDLITLDFNEEAGLTELKFKCPLLEKNINSTYTKNKNICSITHGLLTGLCQFTGLGKVTVVETQIRNNSELCSFTILHW